MDKNTRYIILALVGAAGVYIIYKGGYLAQWFPSLFGPAVPTPGTTGSAGASAAGSTQPTHALPPATASEPYRPPATQLTPTPTPTPAPTPAPISISPMEKIQNLAAQSGVGPLLNADQWCYYAGQLGITCPDPGSIDPDLYAGAWGPGTDRTTPIAVDTFWYLATTTDPSLTSLSGLSAMAAATGWIV